MNEKDKYNILAEIETIEEQLSNLKDIVNGLDFGMKKRPSLKDNIYKEEKKVKPKPKKKKLTPKPSISIIQIINFWNNSGLRQHKTPDTNIYRNIVKRLKKVKAGTVFNRVKGYDKYKNKKFENKEIIDTIQNFALMATNLDYLPSGNYKEYLAKISLLDFLYNPKSHKNKSMFVYCIENMAQLSSESSKTRIEDKKPRLTKAIQRIYTDKKLGGIIPNFTKKEMNNFRLASNKLAEFYKINRKKLNSLVFNTGNQEIELASLLYNSIIADIGVGQTKNITTGWLSSDLTFSQRLPGYLQQQGLILS